jgi:hypothetical protein
MIGGESGPVDVGNELTPSISCGYIESLRDGSKVGSSDGGCEGATTTAALAMRR